MTLPVTAIVVTKNEEARIAACLGSLKGFTQVIVVDSASRDRTAQIAIENGAQVIDFVWSGQYPKKRQWTLDQVPLKTDWVLWIDADEIMTPELGEELRQVFSEAPACDGYFIRGLNRVDGKLLRHGTANLKLALFDRRKFGFPVVDDLDIPGMGEIEGHYQPVAVAGTCVKIGTLRKPLIHGAYDDERAWIFRHEKYARWEAGMNRKQAWPADPVPWRQTLKIFLRGSFLRPQIMFVASYFLKAGFLDGRAGYKFAKSRYLYYRLIRTLDRQ